MLETFLRPVHPDLIFSSDQLPGALANHVRIHLHRFPDLEGVKIAMFGINDARIDGMYPGASQAADVVRSELYRLMCAKEWSVVADLGNVEAGDSPEDTRFAVQTVLHELSALGICAVLIGGDEGLASQQYHALKNQSNNLEIVYCGKKVNFREGTWLNKVVLDSNSHLFNFYSFGHQTYLTEQASVDVMERMFFDPVRLGTLRSNLKLAEPAFRSAHLAVFDCGVIRASEFPAVHDASPNGLLNEEACQLARYAGLGGQCMSVGFFNYSPELDNSKVCARQVAQMIWFFLEAFPQRRAEHPSENNEQFTRYVLVLKENQELVFYKSQISDRWWMEIPHPKSGKQNTLPIMVPCNYEDYLTASNEELPDLWWRFYQKYSV